MKTLPTIYLGKQAIISWNSPMFSGVSLIGINKHFRIILYLRRQQMNKTIK